MCSVGTATFFCCREAQSLCLSALQGFFFCFFFLLLWPPDRGTHSLGTPLTSWLIPPPMLALLWLQSWPL